MEQLKKVSILFNQKGFFRDPPRLGVDEQQRRRWQLQNQVGATKLKGVGVVAERMGELPSGYD